MKNDLTKVNRIHGLIIIKAFSKRAALNSYAGYRGSTSVYATLSVIHKKYVAIAVPRYFMSVKNEREVNPIYFPSQKCLRLNLITSSSWQPS
jgi:hypothetical protein